MFNSGMAIVGFLVIAIIIGAINALMEWTDKDNQQNDNN